VPTDCGRYVTDESGTRNRTCGFSDFVNLIQRVIEYIIILVLPILAIIIAYTGYLFLTSGGNPSKRTAAKNAVTNALIGVVVILAAWLIVRTIVMSVGATSEVTKFLSF